VRRRRIGSLIFIVVVALAGLAATFATGSSPELGLDLQGGASVVLQPPDGTPSDAVDQAIDIIRSRVDALGVAEPDITRQGDTVLVELPGVKDQQRAIDLVGQTAELRFRPVLNLLPPEGAPVTTTTTAAPAETTTTTAAPAETTTTAAPEETARGQEQEESTTTTAAGETTTTTVAESTTTTTVPEVPTTSREEDKADQVVVLPSKDGTVRYQLGPTTVLGSAVSTASADFDGISQWSVGLKMTSDGITGFNALASECFNAAATCPTKLIAITLDGEVVSAPEIQAPTYERDQIQITGNFDESEAKDLSLVLRYGALPVQLERQDAQTVSASLGKDSLRAGLIAGAVGTVLVLLYMLFYYRLLGAVVIAGLAVWSALQWSIISWLGETQGLALSLAGVTGIIVSIGVTVDSYVVFFERLKDELRRGSTARTSVERGFRHAFRTILIADTSAFIGAATLYLLTVGPVRGFAFFLGLSTLLDVVTAWFFTRPLVGVLARRRRFAAGSFIGLRGAEAGA
jgi:preprotein translocase subunit SecD